MEELETAIKSLDIPIQLYRDNTWTLFKENPPKKNGWYYCTVIKDIGGYARELFYKNGRFLDNIRINMFELYDIFGKATGEKIFEDSFDWTDKVVAWMPLPEPYKGDT